MNDHDIFNEMHSIFDKACELDQFESSDEIYAEEARRKEQEWLEEIDPLEMLPSKQSINPCWELGVRPLCYCCGGQYGKGKRRYGKAMRHERGMKDSRAKPRYKDKRRLESMPAGY